MAGFAAETDRFGEMVRPVTAYHAEPDEAEGCDNDDDNRRKLLSVVQVDYRQMVELRVSFPPAAAFKQDAYENKKEASRQDARNNHIGEDSDVGIIKVILEINNDQGGSGNEPESGHYDSEQTGDIMNKAFLSGICFHGPPVPVSAINAERAFYR